MAKIKLSSHFDLNSDFVLYEGDVLDLLSEIPDGFVKLIVTSPPYNIGKPYEDKLQLEEYIAQQKRM